MIRLFISIFNREYDTKMEQLKKETVTSAIFILCIMIFFICLIPTWYTERENSKNRSLPYVSIEWEKEYPFNIIDIGNEEKHDASIFKKYISVSTLIKDKCSSVVNNGTIKRARISELYCGLLKLMGYKRIIGEDTSVLVLENGNFSNQSLEDRTAENKRLIENLREFQMWLNNQNIQYLYVMEPSKFSNVDSENLYEGYVDYQKYNMDTFSEMMERENINFLDLQKVALQTGDLNDLFYRTDHHWKPSTALWATSILAETLNNDFNYTIDLKCYNPDDFYIVDYGKRFLGSQGKKVTLAFAEPDKFELLLPGYNTELHVKIPSLGIDKTGTLYETLIDQEALREEEYPDNYYNLDEYNAYGYGNQPLITIENTKISDDSKILIIKDSFVDSLGPFFALGIRNVSLIDLRYFTGSIRAYIQEYEPDIVITMRSGADTDLRKDFELHQNIMDYR